MTDVFVGLGSNINPELMLLQAYKALQQQFPNLQISPVYRNKAIGFDGPDFLNCVTFFTTNKSLSEVTTIIRETQWSIDKRSDEHAFNSRRIDLDLLIYGDLIANELGTQLPRVDITDYAFVLKPLVDLAPDYKHPELQKSFQSLWDEFTKADHPLTHIEFNWE